MRIVSLLPSCTEIICALGFEAELVGRSHECDYPASIKDRPILTAPRFKVDGSSREIDESVKTLLENTLSVYELDAEQLRDLAPDVIVTQSQCEVCAVSFDEVKRAADEWLENPAEIVSLQPNSLNDVFADMKRVGAALNVEGRADDLVRDLQRKMVIISQRANMLERPSVALIEWIDPLMIGGNWMPTLVEMSAGNHVLGESGQPSRWIGWEELIDADPDILVIAPCGFNIGQSLNDIPALLSHPDWRYLRAVRLGQVYIADGHQYFNRPGPRLVESLEILAEIMHPYAFSFGHQGVGWIKL